jgi:O-antigen/teichoic acid export membrane protein
MKIFGSTIAYNVAMTALNVVAGWLTARALGPVQRGELSAVILWPSLLYLVQSLGLYESVIYFIGKDPAHKRMIVATATILLMLISAGVTVASVLIVPHTLSHYDQSTRLLASLYCLATPVATLSMIGASVLIGTLKLLRLNMIRVANSALSFAVTLSLIATHHATVLAFVLLSFAANVLTLVLCWEPFVQRGMHSLVPSLPVAKTMLSYGRGCYIAGLCNMANSRLDQALIAVLLPPRYLGWYVVSVSISALTGLIPSTINTVVFPFTVRSKTYVVRETLVVSLWVTAAVAAAIATVTIVLCPLALRLLYGVRFDGAVLPAQILALGSISLSCGQLLSYNCRAVGAPGQAATSEAIGLAVTLAALPLLLVKLQIVGAAVASLLSYSCTAAYLVMVTGHRLNIGVAQFLLLTRDSRARFTTGVLAMLKRADADYYNVGS